MWNFIGWDNVTTYADEVNKPVRSYLLSVFIAFVTVFLIYFIAVVIAVNSGIAPAALEEQGFPVLGQLLGGYKLGAFVAIGGMASALGLYSSVLLSVSRIPKAMSDDRLLPALLNRLHPKFKSPFVSILCCSVVVSGMVVWTFGELLIIDITLYGAALVLEYVALIRLRQMVPNEHRPFKIPLNIFGLIVMALLPLSVYIIALTTSLMNEDKALKPIIFALLALLSAEVGWLIVRLSQKKKI
jgi:amino acid transporter